MTAKSSAFKSVVLLSLLAGCVAGDGGLGFAMLFMHVSPGSRADAEIAAEAPKVCPPPQGDSTGITTDQIRKELRSTDMTVAQRFDSATKNIKPTLAKETSRHNGLTDMEGGLINLFTSGLYAPLNRNLYDRRCEKVAATANVVTSGLKKLSAKGGTFYRGGEVRSGEVGQYKAGDEIAATAFLSLSSHQDIAAKYVRNAMFEISSTGAPDVSWLSARPEEGEAILPPGTHFAIESFEDRGADRPDKIRYYVKLKQLPAAPAAH